MKPYVWKSRYDCLEQLYNAKPKNRRNSRYAVNHEEKIVFFSAWDDLADNGSVLICGKDKRWSHCGDDLKRKHPGHEDAIKMLKLVEEEGYDLRLVWLYAKDTTSRKREVVGFHTEFHSASLRQEDDGWYADL